MSLGLDTSVVVRLIAGEPESLVRLATERIRLAMGEGERVLVSNIVVAEAYFALQRHYRMSKADARTALLRLADSGDVEMESEAVEALRETSSAGLVDRMIQANYRGAAAVTLTFDRKFGRRAGVELLRESGRR